MMQTHYIQQQKEAIVSLKKDKPKDISDEEFEQIRKKAADDWPLDYVMRHHAETQQINSLRQLRNM